MKGFKKCSISNADVSSECEGEEGADCEDRQ